MDVDFAFISDYADQGTKLSAIGIGFDTIYAPQVPCAHPNFHLAVQFSASAAEVGHKDVQVRLMDADGKDIIPLVSAAMDVPQPPPGVLDTHGRLVIGFVGVRFPDYGHYALHVVVQGNEMVRIPIRVAQPPGAG